MGHNFPDFPVLGALLLMPLGILIFSIIFGATYALSRSIWVPTLFHAGLNLSTDLSNTALGTSRDSLAVNLLWLGCWLVVAVLCWRQWQRIAPEEGTTTSAPVPPPMETSAG